MRAVAVLALVVVASYQVSGHRFAPTRGDEARVEFRVDTSLSVKFRLPDGATMSGRFDERGTFIPNIFGGISGSGHFGSQCSNDPVTEKGQLVWDATEQVYEFRSGALVHGKLTYPGRFAPTVGAKVISVNDYTPGEGLARIYNLPGNFVAVPDGKKRKVYTLPPYKPFEGIPKLRPYTWKPMPGKPVAFLQDGKLYAGILDATGRFVEDRTVQGVPDNGQKELVTITAGNKVTLPVINRTQAKDEVVLEYRHRKFFAGTLQPDGTFKPIDGATFVEEVIFFLDDMPGRVRVYNFPGEIVKTSR